MSAFAFAASCFLAGFAVWGALWWWARGGRFGEWCRHGKHKSEVFELGALFVYPIDALRLGFEPGTQVTRAVTMLMFALPLTLLDWRLIAMWPALHAAVAMLGWGSYMDMGRGWEPDNERTAPLLRLLGLRDGTLAYDFVGMCLSGTLRAVPIATTLSALGYNGWVMFGMVLMGPIYWVTSRYFDDHLRGHTEFAEMATGATVSTLFCIAIFA